MGQKAAVRPNKQLNQWLPLNFSQVAGRVRTMPRGHYVMPEDTGTHIPSDSREHDECGDSYDNLTEHHDSRGFLSQAPGKRFSCRRLSGHSIRLRPVNGHENRPDISST
jgi:hypothetical protein